MNILESIQPSEIIISQIYTFEQFTKMLNIQNLENLTKLGPFNSSNHNHMCLLLSVYSLISKEQQWPSVEEKWKCLGFKNTNSVLNYLSKDHGVLLLMQLLYYCSRSENPPYFASGNTNIDDVKIILDMTIEMMNQNKIPTIGYFFYIFGVLLEEINDPKPCKYDEIIRNLNSHKSNNLKKKICFKLFD